MAVIQKNGLLHYIDDSGNVYVLYPITTLDNVSGTGKLLLSEDGKTIKTLDGTGINVANEESDPTVPAWAKKENPPTLAEIGAGTFAGAVVANAEGQTPSTSLLRNSKLVSAERNPTVNGEICWTYE